MYVSYINYADKQPDDSFGNNIPNIMEEIGSALE